jgi:hypothetical protein
MKKMAQYTVILEFIFAGKVSDLLTVILNLFGNQRTFLNYNPRIGSTCKQKNV